jgi:EmrB/QacA subfamily drug resistance transporter
MRRYLIFICAASGLLMHSIDGTAVAVAFPNFMKDFGTNVLWAGWTISIYLIAVTSIMPLIGSLSDSFGRKRIFLLSLGLFTASSFACGLAPNIYTLVGFRFLQGIGGASFLPTAAGIVSDQFPEHRERAIGLFTSIFHIGAIVGPNLGGWVVSRYSWRYIFYINLPIGIALIVLIMILLEDSEDLSRSHIDFVGASYFFGAILFLMLGLNFLAENLSAFSLFLTAFFFALTLSFLALFFFHERKEPKPILDLVLLKSRPFLASNLFNLMTGAALFGIFTFIPLYVTSVHQLSTLVSGMILTPRSVAVIITSMVTSFLLKRWGYRFPMLLGLSIICLATLLLGEVPRILKMSGNTFGVAESVAFIVMIIGVGIGIVFPASNNACIELMPERVATITAIRGVFGNVGGTMGISLITIILHLSSTPASGFRIAFLSFGLGLLFAIPLVFLMPSGILKREVSIPAKRREISSKAFYPQTEGQVSK